RETLASLLSKLAFRFSDVRRKVSENISEKTEYVFPAFMDLEYFRRPVNLKRKKIILFAGVLEKVKRVDLLIDVFSGLSSHNLSEYRLIIAGEGSCRKELEMLCRKKGIADRVDFAGKVDRKCLKDLYYRSELLVLPSYSEGFGRVVAEAAVCGCKVLVSEKCGITERLNQKNVFSGREDMKKKLMDLLDSKNSLSSGIECMTDEEFISGMKSLFLSS
ncbi:MAG: glycosyltransferase, partial [Candidatus Muiribacteriaceae bacterium]